MRALSAIVLVHFVLSFVHGAAHSGAQVGLSTAGTLFVYGVILAGPLIGLGVGLYRPGPGAWIVAVTMVASLLFGVINHFIVRGADHVAQVASAWRTLFASTAALLAVVEAAGAAVGVRDAVRMRGTS